METMVTVSNSEKKSQIVLDVKMVEDRIKMARNYLLDKKHEIEGCDSDCPRKPCWNPHNCDYRLGNT